MISIAQNAQLPAASAFEQTIDGKQTHLFILKNKNGVQAAITNYGGCIVSILVPDKNGKLADVVEGFDSIAGYVNTGDPYYSALIGRFANRIANGKFSLDGKEYNLFVNNGANTLHGGKPGFESVIWDAKQEDEATLSLTYLAKDMEAGFPGNLTVKVIYHLNEDNGLAINYEATTDKPTVINLTSHPFFNLNGVGSGNILDHTVQIHADAYTPVNSGLIPTGKLETVKETPFDFDQPTKIGLRINDDHEQLNYGNGYDHNYVLNNHDDKTPVAIAIGDKSGIEMSVYTIEPGMQFYTGNFMQSKNIMKYGHKDDRRTAFAMETQHFPDSPNQPNFPSTVLKPGEVYKSYCEYRFSVAK
jgi:aldose 1-epimerase